MCMLSKAFVKLITSVATIPPRWFIGAFLDATLIGQIVKSFSLFGWACIG